uniref:Uncharacterized protein n=1 Tax=Gouania willdenowi TaxID=441366 RepID=A0A8C5EX65_GOUWI
MLQDVRSSYRVREEQLSSAARFYKKRLQKVVTAHHALLVTYRAQREQILAKPGCDLDPGPPEADFILEAAELKDGKEKEDKTRPEGPLQEESLTSHHKFSAIHEAVHIGHDKTTKNYKCYFLYVSTDLESESQPALFCHYTCYRATVQRNFISRTGELWVTMGMAPRI